MPFHLAVPVTRSARARYRARPACLALPLGVSAKYTERAHAACPHPCPLFPLAAAAAAAHGVADRASVRK